MSSSVQPVEIFYSYAHKDESLLKELIKHLSTLKWRGVISQWHDRDIGAGREWDGIIDRRLDKADVILLLVSASFLASAYCSDVEVGRALERHERGEARVIPVILRPCDWQGTPFGRLQALPQDGKPVINWKPRDDGFLNVARGIQKAVGELIASRNAPAPPPKETPAGGARTPAPNPLAAAEPAPAPGAPPSDKARGGSDKAANYLSPAVAKLLKKADCDPRASRSDLLVLNQDLRASRSDGVPFVLEGKELSGTIIKNATAHNMRFKGCNLALLKLHGSRFRRVDFERSSLQWLTVYDSEFDKGHLAECDLSGALFVKVVVNRETKISNCKLDGAVFYASTFKGRTEERARREWPEARFDGCHFEPAKIVK